MTNENGHEPNMNQSGQAVLIVLLGMAIALTVALSILGSSTSDINLSSNQADSLRAFSAAEAGIEQSLVSNSTSQGSFTSATYNSTISNLALGQNNFIYPVSLANGDSGVLWFVSHGANGSLVCDASNPCFTGKTVNVCWGKPGEANNLPTTPAIEVSVFYLATPGNLSTARLAKALYDPNPGRISTDSFSSSDAGNCTIGSVNYAFHKQIDLSTLGIPGSVYNVVNGLQFMPIKMLYNSTASEPLGMNLNFAGDSTLPAQGSQVISTGKTTASTRKIQFTKAYNEAPAIFDSAIFSPGGIQ